MLTMGAMNWKGSVVPMLAINNTGHENIITPNVISP